MVAPASSCYDNMSRAFVLALAFFRPVLFRAESRGRAAASSSQNLASGGGDRLLHRGTAAGAAVVPAEEPAETQ